MNPHAPKSVSEHRIRFKRATLKVWGWQEVAAAIRPPSSLPEQQFDFDDGLRMIVTTERDDRTPDQETYLHVSASASRGTPSLDWLLPAFRELFRHHDPKPLEALISGRLQLIGGPPVFLVMLTPGCIPHFTNPRMRLIP